MRRFLTLIGMLSAAVALAFTPAISATAVTQATARPAQSNAVLRPAATTHRVSTLTSVDSASALTKDQHASSEGIPEPPVGWHPPPRPARPWLDPHAITRTEKLSPADCAQVNAERAGAAPNCEVKSYFLQTGGNHLPVPAGTRYTQGNGTATTASATTASEPAYFQWGWYSYTQCSAHLGCNGWNENLQIYGVANYDHVYQWYHYCTAGGNLVDNTTTWCGYNYNGGTYNSNVGGPAMQFGDDNKAQQSLPGGGVVTGESGQRVWVSWAGFDFDYWNFGGDP